MDVVLIAGLWLPVAEWDPVVAELAALGHRRVPLALPGKDDRNADATLDDQLVGVALVAASRCPTARRTPTSSLSRTG
ncbi:MAG: hypothetical protein ACOH16_13490 [Propionibacteriaceae bacterium]